MHTLIFDPGHEDDHERCVRALAQDMFDLDEDDADFNAACAIVGIDAGLQRAIAELGEEDCAQIFDEELDRLVSIEEDCGE